MQGTLRRVTNGLISVLGARLPIRTVERLADEALRTRHRLHEIVRQREARSSPAIDPPIVAPGGEALSRSILEASPPWSTVTPLDTNVPGMLTGEEKRYYTFIARFYSGVGDVVELGPWLGHSTLQIAHALRSKPEFRGRFLHVFDDFVWRNGWMREPIAGTDLSPIPEHASFQGLFEQHVQEVGEILQVTRGKLSDYDGNEDLETIQWSGAPIELIFVDCGRSLEVNHAWWRAFSPSFIPNRTLVVMQDWRHYSRVPEIFWENTKLFSDSHSDQLELIHELLEGALATFVYRRP